MLAPQFHVLEAADGKAGLALARDYAKRRVQFGAPLADKPLHVDTLAGMQAEFEGAFLLAFRGLLQAGLRRLDHVERVSARRRVGDRRA